MGLLPTLLCLRGLSAVAAAGRRRRWRRLVDPARAHSRDRRPRGRRLRAADRRRDDAARGPAATCCASCSTGPGRRRRRKTASASRTASGSATNWARFSTSRISLPGSYTLEVSSPGLDRPLRRRRRLSAVRRAAREDRDARADRPADGVCRPAARAGGRRRAVRVGGRQAWCGCRSRLISRARLDVEF